MKKLMLYGLLSLTLLSCFDDSGLDILFEDSFVEIDEATTSSGLAITKIYTRVINSAGIRDSLRVNLVGPQRSTDVSITFAVDASSTAVAGTHYQFITTGNSVVIPANSSYGYIKFFVLDDNIAPSTTTQNLRINLTGGDVPASVNYSNFTRRIRTQ